MNILLLGRKDIAKAEDIVSAMKNIGNSVDFLLFPNFHYGDKKSAYTISCSPTPSSRGLDTSLRAGEEEKKRIPRIRSRVYYYFFHFFHILHFLFRNFGQKQYDVLFAIDWFEGVILLTYRFFCARKARVIFYGYDFYFFDKKLSSRHGIFCIDRWVTRHADEVWVVSENIQKEREKRGVFVKKAKTVPLGIMDKKLQYNISNTKHFLFVGNLKEGHNLRFLVSVFSELVQSDPRYELTIAGQGNLFDELRDVVRKKRMKKYIHLRGFVSESDLMLEIKSGKYTAGIALYEDTREIQCADPGKVKDYLSWRLPVIMTAYNDIAKDVERYGLGYIFQEDRAGFLSMIQSLQQEDLFRKQKNIDRYVQEHSFESIIKRELLTVS